MADRLQDLQTGYETFEKSRLLKEEGSGLAVSLMPNPSSGSSEPAKPILSSGSTEPEENPSSSSRVELRAQPYSSKPTETVPANLKPGAYRSHDVPTTQEWVDIMETQEVLENAMETETTYKEFINEDDRIVLTTKIPPVDTKRWSCPKCWRTTNPESPECSTPFCFHVNQEIKNRFKFFSQFTKYSGKRARGESIEDKTWKTFLDEKEKADLSSGSTEPSAPVFTVNANPQLELTDKRTLYVNRESGVKGSRSPAGRDYDWMASQRKGARKRGMTITQRYDFDTGSGPHPVSFAASCASMTPPRTREDCVVADEWIADLEQKASMGIATELVTMHPRERDYLWGSNDAYRVSNPVFSASSVNIRQTPEYRELHATRKEKIDQDKKWRADGRAAAEPPAPPPAEAEWWSTDQWSEADSSAAWKRQKW
jgi:hypothetical protein